MNSTYFYVFCPNNFAELARSVNDLTRTPPPMAFFSSFKLSDNLETPLAAELEFLETLEAVPLFNCCIWF
jgi:hypothetical protein